MESFLQCPRCFWLDGKAGIHQTPGLPFNLNNAVDHRLKNEVDRYRGGAIVPPRLRRAALALISASHAELHTWRQNVAGVRVEHAPTALAVYGAIDDLWADANRTHFVVDCTATSKKDNVSLDAGWHDGYKRQVEFYRWLLRGRGLTVSDRAWLVYANGIRDDAAFDDVPRFRTKLIAYDGDAAWVEPALHDIADYLASDRAPAAAENCECCSYVARAGAVE